MPTTVASAALEAIAAANERFMRAFDRGDAATIAALYTDDGQLLPPGAEVVAGRENIRAFWQGAMDGGVAGAALAIAEVEEHGETATEVSRYTLFGAGPEPLDRGKYVIIWKHERGEWKMHRDIFNSSAPVPQP